jgi:hypothetical protein
MEETCSEKQLVAVQKNCANRQAPQLSGKTQRRLMEDYPDTEDKLVQQWKRIWHIMRSVCVTVLWMQRNRVIFQHEDITLEQSIQEYWATGIRQVHALGKRNADTRKKSNNGPGFYYAVQDLKNHPESSLHARQAPYNHRTRKGNRRC